MGEGLNSLIFDSDGIWGFRADFMQNVLAEGMGTLIGIIISVVIAIWLDRQREKNRHRDHRGRAVTRWVKNHSDMIDALQVEMSHGAGDRHRAVRTEIVRDAERDAKDIRDDYSSALKKGAVAIAFEDYVRELQSLTTIVSADPVDIENYRTRMTEGIKALKSLVQKAGARRSILQTEPLFDGTLPGLQHSEDSP
ncbi:hypothetical protein [Parvularcula sp. LCG005]|uniref:hypothetical protein n=1 Tax=Parvularcula sp. LCG005 TaxID=3078805 RepID=UPI0029426FE8|nr:hypothetical protein [Parvularcula sp. LCG005]WOI54346.1 hypothetical protein RUI03_04930 [Parvularcula sp. LCG005]